jgi:hypothetical protein
VQPVPYDGDGLLAGHLTADALDRFVEVAGAHARFPLLSIELRHLGGALRRTRPEHGAADSFDADYLMFALGLVPTPELKAPVESQVQAVKDALAPWAAKRMYLNFAETHRDAATFWTEQAYHRLRRIKTAVDPGNVIRSNHAIEPRAATHGDGALPPARHGSRPPAAGTSHYPSREISPETGHARPADRIN